MKIHSFDPNYGYALSVGGTSLASSSGSNTGDVIGGDDEREVIRLRNTVSLGSNLSAGVSIGDTLTIIQTAGTVIARFATPSNSGSFGSNATRVSEVASGGSAASVSRSDHTHDGIGTVTASSSNTLQRGTLNLRAGSNVSFGLTDTDGDGEHDTVTINASATGGGGSSGTPVFVGCRVTHNTTQSIGDSSLTAKQFNTETYDTDAFHDNSTNNTRLTVPTGKGGKYHIFATIEFASNTTGIRAISIRVDGTTLIAAQAQNAITGVGNTSYLTVATEYALTAGQYVECTVYQTSGGNLNTTSSSAYAPIFGMSLLGT